MTNMRYLLLTILIFLTGCSNQTFGKSEIKEHLKLKAPKERIYFVKEVDDIRCEDDTDINTCVNHGKIKKYWYPKPVKDGKKKIKITNDKLEKTELIGATGDKTEVQLDEIYRDYNYIRYGVYSTSTVVDEIFSGVQFIKELATSDWYELENPATTTIEAWEEQTATTTAWYKTLLGYEAKADTSTFYPDADPEINSVDGWVQLDNTTGGKGDSWSWTHDNDGSGGGGDRVFVNDSNVRNLIRCDKANSSTYFRLIRGFEGFNTASIPDDDTIISATLSLYADSITDGNTETVGVSQSSPASNTALVTTDFDNVSPLHEQTFSDEMLFSNITDEAYNDFDLPIAWIEKTGVTNLVVRCKVDYSETTSHSNPPGTSATEFWWDSADAAGTSQDPKLVVVHSSAVAEEEPITSQVISFF